MPKGLGKQSSNFMVWGTRIQAATAQHEIRQVLGSLWSRISLFKGRFLQGVPRAGMRFSEVMLIYTSNRDKDEVSLTTCKQ